MVSRRFLLILLRTSLLVILLFHDIFIISLYDLGCLCICSLTVIHKLTQEFFVWLVSHFREGRLGFFYPFYFRITFYIDYVNVSTRSMFVPSMLMLMVGLSNFLHVIIVLVLLVFFFPSNVFPASFVLLTVACRFYSLFPNNTMSSAHLRLLSQYWLPHQYWLLLLLIFCLNIISVYTRFMFARTSFRLFSQKFTNSFSWISDFSSLNDKYSHKFTTFFSKSQKIYLKSSYLIFKTFPPRWRKWADLRRLDGLSTSFNGGQIFLICFLI